MTEDISKEADDRLWRDILAMLIGLEKWLSTRPQAIGENRAAYLVLKEALAQIVEGPA